MHRVDWLFLDMNAFFASAEQHLRPELRGRPVAVVPTMTDRTCCIAVSYEARPYGIKTGTNVGEARRRCPGIALIRGNHEDYVTLHHEIVRVVNTVLPVEMVCSIDEMACRLDPRQRSVDEAVRVAERVKRAIAEEIGPALRCSVGLATNRFLAKVASNLQKPNGLSVIVREELPQRLYGLALDDFPGIGSRMLRRLQNRGVRTTRQLTALSRVDLREVWGSVIGEHWWHALRGDEVAPTPTTRRSLGHSHVLPPALRTDDGAKGVLVRLTHKAAARLRKIGYVAGRFEVGVGYAGEDGWRARSNLSRVNDTPTLLKALETLWRERPLEGVPFRVGVTLTRLSLAHREALPLFAEDRQAHSAARTMDAVNAKFGVNSIYLASMHEARTTAPMRIAFMHIPDLDPATELTPLAPESWDRSPKKGA
ncbi:Y-family DNA polymerase [Botrimarina hoheduenensis]|uniref:DNA polymerase IV n=1 Tax=Botrimarina hoheduenensis TaxID=2528000 RepID=A0A5C5WCM4_9BACT|nr:DNA polymerase [Botrimarina hoheduenensis]TWT47801.1 DNA polymerase IV [Botrimarina hoheduenensis]